jgi:hypothetical protein
MLSSSRLSPHHLAHAAVLFLEVQSAGDTERVLVHAPMHANVFGDAAIDAHAFAQCEVLLEVVGDARVPTPLQCPDNHVREIYGISAKRITSIFSLSNPYCISLILRIVLILEYSSQKTGLSAAWVVKSSR